MSVSLTNGAQPLSQGHIPAIRPAGNATTSYANRQTDTSTAVEHIARILRSTERLSCTETQVNWICDAGSLPFEWYLPLRPGKVLVSGSFSPIAALF